MNFKQILSSVLLASFFAVLMAACGNQPNEAQAEEPAADTAAQSSAPAVLFQGLTVRHTVADFDKWKAEFDAHAQARTDAGLSGISLLRDKDNPNLLFLSMRADDLQKAREFSSSPGLKDAMQKAGVTGAPEITFYDALRFDDKTAASKDRVIVRHRVKDFDAWLKVYDEEGPATRQTEGLMDRALARGIDDPNLVLVSFVITDMAKAKAAINSEAKKNLMMSAGVEGPPQINFYTTQ